MHFEYNGVRSDSFDNDNFRLVVRDVKRDIGPPLQNEVQEIPHYRGSIPVRQDERGKSIPIEMSLIARDFETLEQKSIEIANWLKTEREKEIPKPKELIFDDMQDTRYMAYPYSMISKDDIVSTGQCSFEFFVPVPYREATEKKTTDETGENEGNIPVGFVLTATINESADEFVLELGDKGLTLDSEIEDGDEVVLDTEKHLITLNGIDVRNKLEISDKTPYFKIPPGEFEFTVEPASTSLNIEFRELWR